MDSRRTGAFTDVDLNDFWEDYKPATEPPPNDALVAAIQSHLGFRLPDSYVEFARLRNGGSVKRCCHPVSEPTSWADDHIEITNLYALGDTAGYSLLGELGHPLMQEEWGYPSWGVCIADTPSAGHEQIMFDYRDCGPQGEPTVVYVDQVLDYKVTFIASDFATFIRGLVDREVFE